MRTHFQLLSQEERDRIHERTLEVLDQTGVRVDTARGRQVLADAGARVDPNTHVVRFPRELVEEALRVAPKEFTLGARRPGWDLQMNGGQCTMLVDGEGTFVLDRETGERRAGTYQDWLEATRLVDALDEVGVYWHMIEAEDQGETIADRIAYWRDLFGNFSKHVQDDISVPEDASWFLEVLQVVFGDKATIRQRNPLSFLLCPLSPLVMEGPYTDAYLEVIDWGIPVGVMPMPLMGATAPGSLVSTIVLGNADVLAMLCLVQAAVPGTPFIYAPALVVMDPRSGRYSAGAVENGLMCAAATEMARYYGLPAESSGFNTDHHVPGIQAGYERALNGLLPVLSWPDILVGPGLLGGSMVFSFEQTLIDVEVFRMCRQARRGIVSDESKWLEEAIHRVGPGGNFLAEPSTARGVRQGEWYISQLGMHDTFEKWDREGRPTLVEEAREKVAHILATHEPLPLDEDVERELERIERRARRGLEVQ